MTSNNSSNLTMLAEETKQLFSVIAAAAENNDTAAASSYCRVASASDPVWNEECVYTFYTPYSRQQPAEERTTTNTATNHSDAATSLLGPGIVVNLQTWVGTIPELAFCGVVINNNNDDEQSPPQSHEGLFVRIVKKKLFKSEANDDNDNDDNDNNPKLPTKLGIGVEGGFLREEDKYEIQSTYSIVHLRQPSGGTSTSSDRDAFLPPTIVSEIPFPVPENDNDSSSAMIPPIVIRSVQSILDHSGSTLQQDVQAWQLDQGGADQLPVSKYAADLPFVDNGVVISNDPSTWICQQHPDQQPQDAQNIWMNLSDGVLGGGRRHWDGSGGTNGALDHYEATGRQYPLVVKLGTLSADLSTADCYSYAPDEDGPVQIPNLPELLHKRGVDFTTFRKTAHSTAELEVQLNATYNFFSSEVITEHNQQLTPRSGPLCQGLQNLGNSCYLNSVAQVLFHLLPLQQRYAAKNTTVTHPTDDDDNKMIAQYGPADIFAAVPPPQAPHHVLVQTAKLATALVSGRYSRRSDGSSGGEESKEEPEPPQPEPQRIAPRMFKHVIGQHHVDFSTGQQQDAAQFLQYWLEQLDRAEQAYYVAAQQQNQSNSNENNDNNNDKKTNNTPPFYPPSHWFSFATETRQVCTYDQKVKYDSVGRRPSSTPRETVWSLPIPMEYATTPSPAAVATTTTATTTTTPVDPAVDREPDQKRHKATEGEEETGGGGGDGATTVTDNTTNTATTTTDMDLSAVNGTATNSTTASGTATPMDTGSHSTAATSATGTTATTATMAWTDDETEDATATAGSKTNHPSTNTTATATTATTTENGDTTNTSSSSSKSKPSSSSTSKQPPVPLPQISLETCLDQWAAEHVVDDVRWSHLQQPDQQPNNDRHAALQTTKLVNFPPYLWMQLQRYRWGNDGQPEKLQVELQLPQGTVGDETESSASNDNNNDNNNDKKKKKKNIYIVDLAKYKSPGPGPQPGEELVPSMENDDNGGGSTAAVTAPSRPTVDETALAQLMDMGFTLNGSKRALLAVGGSNVEAAMGWVFEHNNDPDFNDPVPDEENANNTTTTAAAADGVDEATVMSLVEMLGCFTADQVRFGLKQTNNAADRAADWLFSHMDELDSLIAAAAASSTTAGAGTAATVPSFPPVDTLSLPPLEDSTTCSTYQLTGLISHIGKHTGSGHYVAHVYLPNEQQWIIFNDEKVAESEHPPVEHAYLYLWQRTDTLNNVKNKKES